MTYLDTNILIYLMEGHQQYGKIVAETLEDLTVQNQPLITSSITITEFLAGTTSSSLATLQQVPKMKFIALDEVLAEQAANLQRKHHSLQIGDAIHLATAIQEHANLFFTNDKFLAKTVSNYLTIKTL
ncbi:MAG TPA: PIN domain-containing protein [Candidatus Saccharimonadales bacterium]|nr:PIN domain-containing protein [Candidatus Saccharimonadales bacterium]